MARTDSLFASLFVRVSNKDRAFLARQLAVMLESGLPITQALRSLIEQTKNPLLSEVLQDVLVDLENGIKFSSAIKKHPKVFNEVFVSVVSAGESTGKLDTVANLLADEMERDQGFRSRVIGALLYPGFIVLAMIAVGIIMVTRIVPALELVFKESDVALPWTTRTVVFITNSLINNWYVYIIVIVGLIYLTGRYLSTEDGRRNTNALFLRIPAFGNLIRNMEMARFTRILGLMMESGVPIIQALDAVALVLDNVLYKEALSVVARNVERGAPISQSLQKFSIFPITITQMVAVGEQTGKLEQVLQKLATYYEEETNQSIKNISALTEPVIFLIVGLGVAFLVFSIIVPIYNLAGVIK
ncbi:MAG: type II secretion system F family protein [Patescibacteria group bacterium]